MANGPVRIPPSGTAQHVRKQTRSSGNVGGSTTAAKPKLPDHLWYPKGPKTRV